MDMPDTSLLRTNVRHVDIGPAQLYGLHRKLIGFALLLVLGHGLAMVSKYYAGKDFVFGLVPLFDFYEEGNLPTYFSSLNLLLTAILLYAIARLTPHSGKNGHAWRILAAGFVFMSLDEFADLRMILNKAARSVASAQLDAVPLLSVAWTVPVALLLIVLAVYFIPFLLRLKPVYTLNFALAGAAFVLAAIGFETIEGHHVVLTQGVRDFSFMLMVTGEEILEIFSILYFQYFLLRYLNEYNRNIHLSLHY